MNHIKRVSNNMTISSMESKDLEHLRQEISTATDSILKLAKRRQDLATRVAQIKSSQGLPIEDLMVEGRLKEHVSEYTQKIGLDKKLALEIIQVLLDASKTAQRKKIFEDRILSFLDSNKLQTISILGAGRMGGWFAGYFKSLGRKVILFDRRISFAKKRAKELGCEFANDIHTLAEESDLVLVAIPISKTSDEIRRLQDALTRKGQENRCKVIIEISSIKTKVLRPSFISKVPIISIHPLFGESARYYANNTVAVIISRESKKDRLSLDFTKHLFPQFQVLGLRAEAHDKQMALMLSLPHILALAFGNVAARKSSFISDKRIVSPSYTTMKQFAAKALSEDSDVYYEIQSINKFTPLVLQQLEVSIETLRKYLEHGERRKFKKFFDATGIKIRTM